MRFTRRRTKRNAVVDQHHKFSETTICDDKMTFDECELAILRHAVDEAGEKFKEKIDPTDPTIKKLIEIVEEFIREKKCICYGGTAINNILPKHDRFYNYEEEIPDYDFFTDNALDNAKELADRYYEAGFKDVEAKAGVHHGTYKVFVNFIPMADITYLVPDIYKSMMKEAVKIDGILYAPPNYLRMSMYLELSRPAGDVSRWEKVQKRLALLNKNYPLFADGCENLIFKESGKMAHRRDMEEEEVEVHDFRRGLVNQKNKKKEKEIFETIKSSFIDEGLVFFGGFANAMYATQSSSTGKKRWSYVRKIPDFDVLSEEPERSANLLKERLETIEGLSGKISIDVFEEVGEIIAKHYAVSIGKGKNADTVAMIYEPLACHSYNEIDIDGEDHKMKAKIATIDTMLSFYLAFIYAGQKDYEMDRDRILCMAHYLFEVQQKNRLSQKGLLKRFSTECYGKSPTLMDIRNEKTKKFKELMNKKKTREYEEWFLKYNPSVPGKEKKDDDEVEDITTPKSITSSTKLTQKKRKPRRKQVAKKMEIYV